MWRTVRKSYLHRKDVTMLEDYIRAIQYLHENNFAHNDLRHPNLLVFGGRGLLIDFGFTCPRNEVPRKGTSRATISQRIDPLGRASVKGDLLDFVDAITRVFVTKIPIATYPS